MYYFRTEKKEALLKGRRIKYVAETCGVAYPNLIDLLNGKKAVSRKVTAFAVTKALDVELDLEDAFEYVEEE